MKHLISIMVAFTLTSCVSTFYQVYKVVPTEKILSKENHLVYEDENCKISYDLWADEGNSGFNFYNKSNKNIYLNMEESFFILNGIAYNYYKDRVFTNSSNIGMTTSRSADTKSSVTSSGYSVSYNESKVVCIPSLTSKIFEEYKISQSIYRDCDLFKYPSRSQIKTKTFTKLNSPFVFSNRLVYSTDKSGIPIKIENEFYVSEITNYPEPEIFENKYDEYCGQKGVQKIKRLKNVSPDKFYIKYGMRGHDLFKH